MKGDAIQAASLRDANESARSWRWAEAHGCCRAWPRHEAVAFVVLAGFLSRAARGWVRGQGRHWARRLLPLLHAIGLIAWGLQPASAADTREITPEEIRCRYLLACFEYITWTGALRGEEPFVLGVIGPPPFDSSISNRFVTHPLKRQNNRRVTIRVCEQPEAARNCHVVFIGYKDRRQVALVLEALKDQPVWTVGEARDFTSRGGIMNFVFQGKVPFEYSKVAYLRWRDRSKSDIDPDFLNGIGREARD